ncbi:MAG: ACT domain-containing protein [Halioglobus sp.]
MQTSYIITFIGDDRPGLVEQLSRTIEDNHGNWHDSRLSQLGGKFSGLILVSLPAANGDALELALKSLSASGLSVRVTPAVDGIASNDGKDISLTVLGPDRKGIVREISHALAEQQINVIEMDSEVISAPMSGELLFQARIQAKIPASVDLDNLEDTLEQIADQMTLDIDLDAGSS